MHCSVVLRFTVSWHFWLDKVKMLNSRLQHWSPQTTGCYGSARFPNSDSLWSLRADGVQRKCFLLVFQAVSHQVCFLSEFRWKLRWMEPRSPQCRDTEFEPPGGWCSALFFFLLFGPLERPHCLHQQSVASCREVWQEVLFAHLPSPRTLLSHRSPVVSLSESTSVYCAPREEHVFLK